jgi:hypothetical protein
MRRHIALLSNADVAAMAQRYLTDIASLSGTGLPTSATTFSGVVATARGVSIRLALALAKMKDPIGQG